MRIVFAQQPFPLSFSKSLFLCGPSPRTSELPSWRSQAFAELVQKGYDGVVFSPELKGGIPKSGLVDGDYTSQIEWELEAMRRADVIAFWVPATVDNFPALTTRVELGLQADSGKVIFGAPTDAYKTRYMERLAAKFGNPVYDSLESVVSHSVNRLENGIERSGAETLIPLDLFRTKHFQQWYRSQTAAGHELVDVKKVNWAFRMPSTGFPFFMEIHVAMRIKGENRIKENEAVIIRPSISAICAYERGSSGRTRILLVREYRIGVMNSAGFVFELPGGSSFDEGEQDLEIASDEFHKETGLKLPKDRFRYVQSRQIAATVVAHRAHLYAVELASDEMDRFATLETNGTHFGEAQDTERTYPIVRTIEQIVESNLTDAANLGLILTVVRQIEAE